MAFKAKGSGKFITNDSATDQNSDNKPAPRKAKVQQITIVPIIKRKSGYIFEGTMTALDTTRRTWIPITDTVMLKNDVEGVGKEGENVEIRHIRGCTTPYIRLQVAQGIKTTKDDNLFIEDGFKTIRNSGFQVSEFNYLTLCNYNSDNTNRMSDSVNAIFKQFSEEADAAAYINVDEKLFRAQGIVYALKIGQDEYNHDALKFYQRVFRLQGATDVEIFKSFVLLSKKNPDLIIEGIAQEQAGFLEVITRAFEQNLIILDEIGVLSTQRRAYVLNTEGQVSRAIAEEMLLEYFASERGTTEYHALKNEVSQFADREV